MIKFLCLLMAFMVSTQALAQNVDGLFPELAGRKQPVAQQKQVKQQPVESLFDKETEQEAEQRQNEAIRSALSEPDGNFDDAMRQGGQNQAPVISKAEQGFFVFSPSNVQIVTPTIARFQFCTSHLTLSNYTDGNLKTLSVVFEYTPIVLPHTYTNIRKGDQTTNILSLAGESCQMLRRVPNIKVVKCEATRIIEKNGQQTEEPISEEECKAKVKFVMK